jgi:hypothetical protein
MTSAAKIHAGQVWVSRNTKTRTRSRRITTVVAGRVFYSSGGDTTRSCQLRMFRRWIRTYAAIATRTRRARSLTLRGVAA